MLKMPSIIVKWSEYMLENQLIYKNSESVLEVIKYKEVEYLQYPSLEKCGLIKHGFSTRLGGISTGEFSSMNLSFVRGDDEDAVNENFRRIGEAIGVEPSRMVSSKQTHTNHVIVVDESCAGNGVIRENVLEDVDGMVTNIPGLCLATFYADCVPLYFVDPVKKVIGLSHSGWKGTVLKIGKVTIETMEREYGCNSQDILVAIGPSICQDCYEVSEDVIHEFQNAFDEVHWKQLYYQKENNKYQLNLWKANEIILRESGIKEEHIAVTNICTCCNSEFLFSHRASKGRRGNLGAFLSLREGV